jgi:DNA-binding protein HU-beta
LNAIRQVIIDLMMQFGEVRLSGFGTFRVVDRPARNWRNPLTEESIEIRAKKVLKFIPCKELVEIIDQ